MTAETSVQCFNCVQNAKGELAIREDVWRVPGWRLALAFNSSLPGWLVIVPGRHVEALEELSDAETEAMGRLLRDASKALKSVTSCVKTYVILSAEAPGFTHLHVHIVPRMVDLPEERTGTAIFAYLKEEPLSDDQRDGLAREIRQALSSY